MAEAALRKTSILQPAARPTQKSRHLRGLAINTAPVVKQSRLPIVFIGIVVMAIILGHICLSIINTKDAYTVSDLWAQKRDMTRSATVLSEQSATLSSPQNIAENAKSLGMVQNTSVGSLRLSDGVLTGAATQKTEQAVNNSVPNRTLEGIEVLRTDGTTAARPLRQTVLGAAAGAEILLTWTGDLPVPQTR